MTAETICAASRLPSIGSRCVFRRELADRLQIDGLDVDKNAVQRMESGQRFITDIELSHLSRVMGVPIPDLFGACVDEGQSFLFQLDKAEALLESHFGHTLSQLGLTGLPAAIISSTAAAKAHCPSICMISCPAWRPSRPMRGGLPSFVKPDFHG